jgi:uncharacterized surface protein with fasciclin (FAS1) repeats
VVGVAGFCRSHHTSSRCKAGGLVETLSEQDRLPFAPTNAAFDKLPKGTVESLLEPANLKITRYINLPWWQEKLMIKQLLLPLKQEKESSFDNCSRRNTYRIYER